MNNWLNCLFSRRQLSRLLGYGALLVNMYGAEPVPIQKLTVCEENHLRSALETGGIIQCDCDGTILLTSELLIQNDVTLDAGEHYVQLSGQNSVRVLHVVSNASLTLLKVSIINGRSDKGAGLFNEGGRVMASNCLFSANSAIGTVGTNTSPLQCPVPASGTGAGGAVYSSGSFTATQSRFEQNTARGGDGVNGNYHPPFNPTLGVTLGGDGAGGAIYMAAGSVELRNCNLLQNRAQGGNGAMNFSFGLYYDSLKGCPVADGGRARGGCIFIANGQINILQSTIEENVARGGDGGEGHTEFADVGDLSRNYEGGDGGIAQGAACFNAGSLHVEDCNLQKNEVIGGDGRSGGRAYVPTDMKYKYAGRGGNGGRAEAGSIMNQAQVELFRSSLIGNRAAGGGGGRGGSGGDSVGSSADIYFPAAGGAGGSASGGALLNQGSGRLFNCTLAGNSTTGGSGGNGGTGGSFLTFGGGGGIDGGRGGDSGGSEAGALANLGGATALVNCTLADNRNIPGIPGVGGIGKMGYPCPVAITCFSLVDAPAGEKAPTRAGGIFNATGTISLVNTLLAFNRTSSASANAEGLITDFGHNLSSDESCHWRILSSQVRTNLGLGTLGNYGGPTLTLPLMPESPARDAGATLFAPATDQRGQIRPQGMASDIGAFEYIDDQVDDGLTLAAVAGGELTLRWPGKPGIRVQRTGSLDGQWLDVPGTEGKNEAILERANATGFLRLHRP